MTAPSDAGREPPAVSPAVEKVADDLGRDEPVSAAALAEAVLDLHGSEYAGGKGAGLTLDADSSGDRSRPVSEWLETVRALFDAEHLAELDGRTVVVGLGLLDPGLRDQLRREGVLAPLEGEYDVPLTDLLTERGRSLRFPADTVPTQPDRPLEDPGDDQFQRVAFARYLARRIHDVSSSEAYAIHLYGPWGSGKSTLLNFLEAELRDGRPADGSLGTDARQDRTGGDGNGTGDGTGGNGTGGNGAGDGTSEGEPGGDGTGEGGSGGSAGEPWQVVRFNAWQHQHVRPPWWALMDQVYRRSRSELRRRDRLAEFWWRLRSGRLAFFAGVVALAWLGALALPFLLDGATFGELAATADAAGKLLAVGVTVWAGAQAATDSLLGGSARAAQSYVDFVGDPMNAIERRFDALIDRIPGPVAIFVDDLDRCDAEYVVQLLEGIQTLFAGAPVVFVVAADRRWLDDCFEEVYGGQQSSVDPPGKSLGALFLEKTFQFSASVPTIPDEMKAEYWRNLLLVRSDGTPTDGEPDARPASEAIRDADSEEAILRVVDDSRDRSFAAQQSIRKGAVERLAAPEIVERTEHVLHPLAPLLEPNPRSMKRLVNAYSVNRALAILTHVDVERDQLALWTILSLQYPVVAAYLEENPEMVEQAGREKYPDVDDEEVATLLGDQRVVDVVDGTPVPAALDARTVRRCARIRQ